MGQMDEDELRVARMSEYIKQAARKALDSRVGRQLTAVEVKAKLAHIVTEMMARNMLIYGEASVKVDVDANDPRKITVTFMNPMGQEISSAQVPLFE